MTRKPTIAVITDATLPTHPGGRVAHWTGADATTDDGIPCTTAARDTEKPTRTTDSGNGSDRNPHGTR